MSASRILDGAALAEGDTVLDIGTGDGELTFEAHERIGDGWVIAVDPSVDALEELLRRAHERDAGGIMYLVGDAGVLPLPDESVDVALSRVPAEAGELARVLRPGGRVSLCGSFDPDAFAGWADVETSVDDSGQVYLTARRT